MANVEDRKTPPEMADTTERRLQKRLKVQGPATLILPGTNKSLPVLNQEISWGGAIFTAVEPLPVGVASVLIHLPWMRGQHIAIEAAVLRTALLPNDQHLIVVRFSSLMLESHFRLEKLLHILGAKDRPATADEAPDLFHELEVTVDNLEDFRRILEQVGERRFTLYTFNGYRNNHSISLAIQGPDNLPALRLRARVVEIKKAQSTYFDGSDLHLVTLTFEHPRKAITPLIDSLLGLLPKERGASRRDAPPLIGSSRSGKHTRGNR